MSLNRRTMDAWPSSQRRAGDTTHKWVGTQQEVTRKIVVNERGHAVGTRGETHRKLAQKALRRTLTPMPTCMPRTEAGQPEVRRYRIRYPDGDDPVGNYSAVVSVTTVP